MNLLASGGIGAVTVPNIDIPGIPINLTAGGGIGGIDVPAISIGGIPVSVGVTIPIDLTIRVVPFRVPGLSGLPDVLNGSIGPITLSHFEVGPTLTGGTGDIFVNGFTIPNFGLNLPLSGSTSPFTIGGFSIPEIGLNIPLSGSTAPFTIGGISILRSG